jgi:fatty acid desaturase
MKEKPQASIDGKEIEVEILEDEVGRETRTYKNISTWRAFIPIAIAVLAIIAVTILSATLFIWALPVLLPILIVLFIFKLIR